MKISINCPVCRAGNELHLHHQTCRRCKEDLSLLYQTKAYSLKYRMYFIQLLQSPDAAANRRQLMHAATGLVKP
ncbi:MAG: hypothetical protein AAF573_12825 [Bacteroidota bacterium]